MQYFKHGDLITHAQLNEIVNAINAFESQTQLSSYIFGGRDADEPGTWFFGLHLRRWLVYRSTGEIFFPGGKPNDQKLPTEPQNDVLPDCSDNTCLFDLHTLPNLTYGMWYVTEGSEFSLETDTDA